MEQVGIEPRQRVTWQQTPPWGQMCDHGFRHCGMFMLSDQLAQWVDTRDLKADATQANSTKAKCLGQLGQCCLGQFQANCQLGQFSFRFWPFLGLGFVLVVVLCVGCWLLVVGCLCVVVVLLFVANPEDLEP